MSPGTSGRSKAGVPEKYPGTFNSTTIVAICPTNVDYRMPNGQLSFPIDLTFAASFMLLQATREGLGTCIVTTFDEQEVREALAITYSIPVIMLLLIGYADEEPALQTRKSVKQVSSPNHW